MKKGTTLLCDHCGDACRNDRHRTADAVFCCNGCQMVYELLQEGGLHSFYEQNERPGVRVDRHDAERYAFLDAEEIREKLLLFQDEEQATIRLDLPTIHCSSCLYLLEQLDRLYPGVIAVQVDFAKRSALIRYDRGECELRGLVEFLHTIGYPPSITLATDKEGESKADKSSRRLVLKIGVVGFLFGNIMLLSFPDYVSSHIDDLARYEEFFTLLMLLLSLPVLLFGAADFFKSAALALRRGRLTIDVPIAVGILAIFIRSVHDIALGVGPGYLDSMAGLVFFLLIGRWYQSRVYRELSFDRDYSSYFPLAVSRLRDAVPEVTPIMNLVADDIILIRSGGIIPADAELLSDEAQLDYSFVTGESRAVTSQKGKKIYAGARNVGAAVELRVMKAVSQSYLTDLWNQRAFSKTETSLSAILDKTGARFTLVLLVISVAVGVYWQIIEPSMLWNAVTSILIVACPCALALSVPFALGSARRWLAKTGLFVQHTRVVERMAEVDTIIFDKTGTLTASREVSITYSGDDLTTAEEALVAALVAQSDHPQSRAIADELPLTDLEVSDYVEIIGKGISGRIDGHGVKVGSAAHLHISEQPKGTYVMIDGVVKGVYTVERRLRAGVYELIERLRAQYEIIVLSGDNDHEAALLAPLMDRSQMYFEMSPKDKLDFIDDLQHKGAKVMMVGDGLNDAGALKQSDVGVAISDDITAFSPSCDAILEGPSLSDLDRLLRYAHRSRTLVYLSMGFSLLYNVVGVSIAAQGLLSPLIAAILMPLSSVTIAVLATAGSRWIYQRTVVGRSGQMPREGLFDRVNEGEGEVHSPMMSAALSTD